MSHSYFYRHYIEIIFIYLGTSGCGKSTIIQLIERFYDANIGRLVNNLFFFSNIFI
jgi:ABC-type transport system involved in cytochrome bd biosynthesis fused ATPase/permease subunit